MKFFLSIFKLFSSLKIAVLLLILLGIAFGVGTFTESYYGADAAQLMIYRTPWMSVLLIFLALNLLGSALDRIPWKKKHAGFLTTHLGIILILSGSLISHAFGIEGQLAIGEGKTGSRMTLSEPLIQIFSVDSDEKHIYPMKRRPFPWKGSEVLSDENSPIQIKLLTDYPKAKLNEVVEPSDSGSPALHLTLSGSMASIDQWLFLDDPSRNLINLGPATIQFIKDAIRQKAKKNNAGGELGTLKFNFESGQVQDIQLTSKSTGKTISLEGTLLKIKVIRILKDAIVNGNQLLERPQTTEAEQAVLVRNPAVELTLEGNGLSEHHTVFARFPEFHTLHGMKPSEAHVRISYELEGFEEEKAKNELRFVWRPKELPLYQVKAGEKITEGSLKLGEETQTGWMDFKFVVDQYHAHAQVRKDFQLLPTSSQSIEAVPVVLVELSSPSLLPSPSGRGQGEGKKTIWLQQGEIVYVTLGGSDYHVLYGLKTKPLGFQIELQDFMIETDPGTNKPASFKSLVGLKDSSAGINRDQTIQMNEPLKYRGFKVYQSAYQQNPGEPDISIFTVARDPGNGLKYAGTLIMITGIGMLFYVKSLSTLKSSDPKLRSK